MSEAAESAISEIVNVLRTVDGINQVPLNPPSVVSVETFGLVYPGNGKYTAGAPTGTKRGLHNISVDILTKNIDPARCIAKMKPFIDTVSTALGKQIAYDSDGNPGPQFNHTIETFDDLDYNMILTPADYGGVPVLGIHFVMNQVKILVNL